jgi:hypothetical protein
MAGEDWNLNIRRTALTFDFLCLDCGSAGYRNFGRTQRQIAAWLVRGFFLLFPFIFYLFIYWRAVDRGRGCSLCINT